MAKKDFCYCNGVHCSIKEWCVRYVEGLKAKSEDGNLWMDECEEDRPCYIATETRF